MVRDSFFYRLINIHIRYIDRPKSPINSNAGKKVASRSTPPKISSNREANRFSGGIICHP